MELVCASKFTKATLPTPASEAGTIMTVLSPTPALTASIIGHPTKTFNGTNSATLTASNDSVSAFVSGQGATETNLPTSGTYASSNAGSNDTVTASRVNANFAGTNVTLLSHYKLPVTASGVGTINPPPDIGLQQNTELPENIGLLENTELQQNVGLQQSDINFGQILLPNNLLTSPDLFLPVAPSIQNVAVDAPFAADLVSVARLTILNGGVNAPFATDHNGSGAAHRQTVANQ